MTREEAVERIAALNAERAALDARRDALDREVQHLRAEHNLNHVVLVRGMQPLPAGAATTWMPMAASALDAKIATVKCLRAYLHIGLKEAKDIVEGLPHVLPVGMDGPLVRVLCAHGAEVVPLNEYTAGPLYTDVHPWKGD